MNESDRPAGVLVVDDDSAIRRMMDLALRGAGFDVWLAATGDEAVELFQLHRAKIGVVMTDVLMPGMDGPATIRALRKLEPELPVCIHTACAGTYADAELLASGACTILNKPCPLATLIATLETLLEPGRGEAP